MEKRRSALDIIDGYKGIMPLDMRDIDPKYRNDAIKQHEHDIAEYIKYQKSLSPRLRYENTVMRAEKLYKIDDDAALDRRKKREIEQEYKHEQKGKSYVKYAK
jgi:hypothetical protein